jgi:predicted metal-dependent hydrolase
MSFTRPAKQKTKSGLELDDHRELIERLRADAARVAARFALPQYELDADRPDALDRYGICFDDGRIRVRLIHARTGRPLRYSALVDTVVHELAHLRHMDHGPRWEALYDRMLAWCRREGIYAPQARRAPQAAERIRAPERPTQLGLFATRDRS